MAFGREPVFRKIIVAWYDSEMTCGIMIVVMFLLILFGITGISVAVNNAAFTESAWVPCTLVVLASLLMVINILRLLKRFAGE